MAPAARASRSQQRLPNVLTAKDFEGSVPLSNSSRHSSITLALWNALHAPAFPCVRVCTFEEGLLRLQIKGQESYEADGLLLENLVRGSQCHRAQGRAYACATVTRQARRCHGVQASQVNIKP